MTLNGGIPLPPGYGKTTRETFARVVARAEQALDGEGFGILCRIDVQAALRKKLGEEIRPFLILGACNPRLAHRALSCAPEVGVLLPCNVVIRELDDGQTRVEVINAELMAEMIPGAVLGEIAAEVKARLDRVLEAV